MAYTMAENILKKNMASAYYTLFFTILMQSDFFPPSQKVESYFPVRDFRLIASSALINKSIMAA